MYPSGSAVRGRDGFVKAEAGRRRQPVGCVKDCYGGVIALEGVSRALFGATRTIDYQEDSIANVVKRLLKRHCVARCRWERESHGGMVGSVVLSWEIDPVGKACLGAADVTKRSVTYVLVIYVPKHRICHNYTFTHTVSSPQPQPRWRAAEGNSPDCE